MSFKYVYLPRLLTPSENQLDLLLFFFINEMQY